MAKAEQYKLEAERAAMNYQNLQNGNTFGKAVDVIEWESNGSKDVIDLTGWLGHKVSSITNKGAML